MIEEVEKLSPNCRLVFSVSLVSLVTLKSVFTKSGPRTASRAMSPGWQTPAVQGETNTARSHNGGNRRRKRAPALGLGNHPYLPSADCAVCFEWQRIEPTDDDPVANVKFGQAIVAARIVGVLERYRFRRTQGVVVERFRPGIGREQLQAMGKLLVQR